MTCSHLHLCHEGTGNGVTQLSIFLPVQMIQPNCSIVKSQNFPVRKLDFVRPITILTRTAMREDDDRVNRQLMDSMQLRKVCKNPSIKILPKYALMLQMNNEKRILVNNTLDSF
jgi:hypothetical protein